MALNFTPPAVQKYIGTPYGVPISLCTPLKSPPAVVPLFIDWSLYGASSVNPVAIQVDLTANKNPANALDAIRSVYIDNSFSFTPIYVIFPDTGFTVICPANSIVMSPVFVNDSQKIIIYANAFIDGQIPFTDIHISNVPQPGFVTGTGALSPPVKYPSIIYQQSRTNVGGGLTQTFLNQNIGTVDATRIVYVAVHAALMPNGTCSGVTIGGNAATLVAKKTNGGTNGTETSLWALAVPTGTTATVVATFTVSVPNDTVIDILTGYNLTNPLVGTVGSANGSNVSFTVTSPNNGIAIGAGTTNLFSPASMSGLQSVAAENFGTFGYETTTGAIITAKWNSGDANASLLVVSIS